MVRYTLKKILIHSAASSFGKLKAHFAERHSSEVEVELRPSGRSWSTPLSVSPYRDPKLLGRVVGGLIISLCFTLAGCASLFARGKLTQLENELSLERLQIKQLKESLEANGQLLKEKDAKIEQLRKQLESLGVFPK